MKKVLVIGLDSLAPDLVFNKWFSQMPNLKRLAETGFHGNLETVIPPITCPAWMSMMTGQAPNKLGVYGFNSRKNFSYTNIQIANSLDINERTVWEILSEKGMECVVVGVPLTYPPKPLQGCMITSFLTPSLQSNCTYPTDFKNEVLTITPGYMLDVDNYRTNAKEGLLTDIYRMTENRFKLMRHLLKTRHWQFAMVVEMGPDRMHHAFWKYFDTSHNQYVPGNSYENAMLEYYRYLDDEVGRLIAEVDDETTVLIVSDHGAKSMKGCFCINEWLINEGYLVLKQYPSTPTDLRKCDVDWGKTKAFGWGGYHSNIFLNVEGREPQGIIPPHRFEEERARLIGKLLEIPQKNGSPMDTLADTPENIYRDACKGETPDIMAFFDDLYYRAAGTIGHGKLYLDENDTGPDDAVHDWNGVFIMKPAGAQHSAPVGDYSIYDIAPTILSCLDVEIPKEMMGKIIQ